VTACSASRAGAQRSPTAPAGSPSPSASPSPSPAPAPSVFVIVMENKTYADALSGTYTASLARRYGVATNYHAVSHPSLPNYLALTSGSTWGIADDGYHRLPAQGLGDELTAAGISWRAYMEGMTGGCFDSPYPYALKHNPFAYYGGACPPNVVSLAPLATDLAADTPRFVWITPDLCHDTHDCSVATGDAWLAQVVPEVMASRAWSAGGLLLLTWDEGFGTSNEVLTVALEPGAGHVETATRYDHYSLLATIEDRLGVARLGATAQAAPMRDIAP